MAIENEAAQSGGSDHKVAAVGGVLEKQGLDVMTALMQEYHTLWLVNKCTHKMRLVRSHGVSTVGKAIAMAQEMDDCDEVLLKYVETYVEPSDRVRVARDASRLVALDALTRMPLYTVSYRRRDEQGTVNYHQLAFADAGDDFIVAFRDIQAMVARELEVQHEVEAQESAKRIAELQNLLSTVVRRVYDIYFRVDVTTGTYALVFDEDSEEMQGQWHVRGDYRNLYAQVHEDVDPAFREIFERKFKLEALKRRRKDPGVILHEFMPVKRRGLLGWFDILVVGSSGDENVVNVLIRNATSEVEARNRHQRELDAAAAQANEAKSLFFSSVSHDIRTPLNAIVGFSELLARGVEDEAERNRYVSTINSNGKMLARLIDDVLDLSKLEKGTLEIIKEPADIAAVAQEVVRSFEVVRADKPIVLRTDVAMMPRVKVDAHRIRQILYNLISNAFKYTDRGQIVLRTSWQNGTLTFSVSDTGKGITQENITRILQPFVQVADRNHRDGTGLGLSICHRLVQLMGGELTIQSTVGRGSIFTVTLRGIETAAACVSAAESCPVMTAIAPSKARLSRVLVVDDSKVNLMVMKALLLRCGAREVVLANDGSQALTLLQKDSAFDAVFTDYWMPEMDGIGLVKAIRSHAQLAKLAVYLVTADVEAHGQCDSAGFDGILYKPVSVERVQSLVSGSQN